MLFEFEIELQSLTLLHKIYWLSLSKIIWIIL